MSQLSWQYSSSLETHDQEEYKLRDSFCQAKWIFKNTEQLLSAPQSKSSSCQVCTGSQVSYDQFHNKTRQVFQARLSSLKHKVCWRICPLSLSYMGPCSLCQ